MSETVQERPLRHICEACGKDELLTPEDAFKQGWDYPPTLGAFGMLSPRTCGDCGIDKTLWWRLQTGQKSPDELTEEEIELVERISNEPDSITPKEE